MATSKLNPDVNNANKNNQGYYANIDIEWRVYSFSVGLIRVSQILMAR